MRFMNLFTFGVSLQGSYGVVKLAYNEDSEEHYVSQKIKLYWRIYMSVCLYYHNLFYLIHLGNESSFKEEADEAVWIFAWVNKYS